MMNRRKFITTMVGAVGVAVTPSFLVAAEHPVSAESNTIKSTAKEENNVDDISPVCSKKDNSSNGKYYGLAGLAAGMQIGMWMEKNRN